MGLAFGTLEVAVPALATRRGDPAAAGILLGAASTLLLGFMANWLAAVLADGAILFYVFVYTLGLKRRTASNIVIGGAAGCFPVLVGWAAVTGTVAWPAVVLFAVIFFWTPPHFWALAMKFKDDYARANDPSPALFSVGCAGRIVSFAETGDVNNSAGPTASSGWATRLSNAI